ncbi:FHA domain protein [Rosistilla carotiformis]|uniref:FHA domain protein n=1 Tax=Rosistilla carotiformis TaxID=2528017 RepID=A0A518JLQ1_9BACT|nr:FHA domain-containing protein [Rosistilla carotiformis]QDV66479.1 FHA domain protein [Rosistilla carotiformis]
MNSITWNIGSDPEADLWIDDQAVSGLHCRLMRDAEGYWIEDLGSTNGTSVNGQWIDQPTQVSPTDTIMLSGQVAMPWPDTAVARQVISIGYGAENLIHIQDHSVSGKHAELIVDPHGQWIVHDLDSTNGTWIGDQAVRSVRLHQDCPFRVGVSTLTIAQIKDKLGPAFIGDSGSSASVNQKAMFVMVPLFVFVAFGALAFFRHSVTSNQNEQARVATADSSPGAVKGEASRDPSGEGTPAIREMPRELDRPEEDPKSDDSASESVLTTAVEVVDEAEGRGLAANSAAAVVAMDDAPESSQASTTVESSAVADTFAGLDRVRNAMFRVVAQVNDTKFDFASAWAAKPDLLITNAHVVGQMQVHGMQVVHLNSGQKAEMESLGIHPSYGASMLKLQAAMQEIAELEGTAKADQPAAELDRIATKIGERKRELPWLQSAVDSYNIGWIRLSSPLSEVSTLAVEPLTIGRKKVLKLANPFIEKDIFEAIASRSVSFVTIRTVGRTIQKDAESPVCWFGQIQASADDWQFCLFDGCPIVDTHGRLAGMYRGASRASTSGETEELQTKIDMVPLGAINMVVQSF